MFKLNGKLLETMRVLTLGFEPAYEGLQLMALGCIGSCKGGCKLQCKGCKGTCRGKCKGTRR
jgi:modification target Cys-rich repeat protein